MEKILSVPEAKRTKAWHTKFCKAIINQNLAPDPHLVLLPDGHICLPVYLSSTVTRKMPFKKLATLCLAEGAGIIVSTSPEEERGTLIDFGSLWLFEDTGSLYPPAKATKKKVSMPAIPDSVRKGLRKVLKRTFGISAPKGTLVHSKKEKGNLFAFNLFPDNFPSPHRFAEAMGFLRWYTRPDYGLIGPEASSELAASLLKL